MNWSKKKRMTALALMVLGLGGGLAGPASASGWTYYKGSAITAGGCKEWLNYNGHYIQMLGESWGDDCAVALTIYHNGRVVSGENVQHTIYGAGTWNTGSKGYWDSSAQGYSAALMVCDHSPGQGGCTGLTGL